MEKLRSGTKELPKLAVGDSVLVQNQVGNHPSKWDITGVVVEVRDHDQYVVKVDGSGRMTLRNRKFLKKITPYTLTKHFKPSDNPIPRPEPRPTTTETPTATEPTTPPVTRVPEQPSIVNPEPVVAETPSPSPPPSPTPTPVTTAPEQPRRSSRVSRAPDRLQPSWGTKSYADVVRTDHCSLVNTGYLHHNDLGGGGGITEYRWPEPAQLTTYSS